MQATNITEFVFGYKGTQNICFDDHGKIIYRTVLIDDSFIGNVRFYKFYPHHPKRKDDITFSQWSEFD